MSVGFLVPSTMMSVSRWCVVASNYMSSVGLDILSFYDHSFFHDVISRLAPLLSSRRNVTARSRQRRKTYHKWLSPHVERTNPHMLSDIITTRSRNIDVIIDHVADTIKQTCYRDTGDRSKCIHLLSSLLLPQYSGWTVNSVCSNGCSNPKWHEQTHVIW